ncbi:hypothetical protein O7626_30700 [Micromonospora sp. WMMD1102]|uniref:hypothetical protein n=1 Tax=Micromonospora sp. WMMD1102 TaxID=3016105 RepID=UPI0024154D05|nr:hypothetical protein [Micromonospora sp. WMMD1102]MDG4790242.1 hypothetical protein [Micromonospora sp. WMMD1102]
MNPLNDPARYTDLTITGLTEDINELVNAAYRAGVLVHSTAPQPCGPGDRRIRVSIRLHLYRR